MYRAKYPPLGGRTSGGSFHTQAYHVPGDIHGRTITQEEYWANANDLTLIIAIIETKEGLENIEEIVSVKGLGEALSRTTRENLVLRPDAIFIGQYDLALSLGSLPQSDRRVIDGVERIFQAGKKAGVPVIAWAPGDQAKEALDKGYEGVIVGLDMSLLTAAGKDVLEKSGAPRLW